MQLDRTHVVIRLRSLSEIGDLALVMIRRYPTALSIGFLLGALPWAVVNALLLNWIPIREMAYGFNDVEAASELWRYLTWMTLLVVLQTPAAGVLTTVFLGQAVFEHQPTWKSVFTEVRRQFRKWFWALGVGRMAVPAMIVAGFRWGQPADALFDILIPLGLLIAIAVLRGSRPFLPEILLLEQCPYRAKSSREITVSRRVRSLHAPLAGDLSGRFLAVSGILLFFTCGLFFTFTWLRGIATGMWNQDVISLTIFYPLALWAVAGFSVMLRLLSYLDTRIRLEGWEVELAIRAEAIRQFGSEAGWIAPSTEAPARSRPSRLVSLGLLVVLCWGSTAAPATGDTPRPARCTHLEVALSLSPLPRSDRVIGIDVSDDFAAIVSGEGVRVRGQESAATTYVVQRARPAGPADRALGETNWFDPEQQQLVPVEVKPQTDDSAHRDSRWVAQPKAKQNSSQSGGSSFTLFGLTLGHLFGWALLALILAALVGSLVYAFMHAEIDLGPNAPSRRSRQPDDATDQQMQQRMKHLPAELRRTGVNLRMEAERLMNAGRFDQATISLFGHQLLLLDRSGVLRLSRGKTNGHYLREARREDPSAAEYLRSTVTTFERSYFGRHEVTGEEFTALWQRNVELEQRVESRREAAA